MENIPLLLLIALAILLQGFLNYQLVRSRFRRPAERSCPGGALIKYPLGVSANDDGTAGPPNVELAREIARKFARGEPSGLPSTRDEHGNPLWDIIQRRDGC